MEEKRGPGRPKKREQIVEVGLTGRSATALRWLMRRQGLMSQTATVNDALEQRALALGWRPTTKGGGQ
jgi:hypothetical protein